MLFPVRKTSFSGQAANVGLIYGKPAADKYIVTKCFSFGFNNFGFDGGLPVTIVFGTARPNAVIRSDNKHIAVKHFKTVF